jgi:hypothetical protein
MGRKSTEPRLFQSIKATSPMMQNLMNIEANTGGERWMRAVDDELTRQKKTVDLREGLSPVTRFGEAADKVVDFGRRLFGKKPMFEPTMGETSGPGGLPGMNQVRVNPGVDPMPYDRSLKGRNPYVQSLIGTMRHELGGHVAEQLTPGGPQFNIARPREMVDTRENAVQGITGEGPPTPRSAEVQKYFQGALPREDY